ncbi:MAG: DUF4397 domain-containing protein [Chloroflexi bacterium]|nr:DUF4397 domain-containing protein [Chloroflexota bacterium]
MRRLVVMLTALTMLALLAVPTLAQDGEEQTIAEIAATNEDFSTLFTAVGLADPAIAELLSGEGEYTVFAPNNAAFESLPEETLNAVLADQALLSTILQYHVVEGEFFAEDVVTLDGQEIETLAGETVTVRVEGENVFVNDAQVIQPDVDASNGVIHVIDSVLLPPTGEETEEDLVSLRVGHFSPDAPPVDIYVDGLVAIEDLAFPSVSEWTQLPSGTYDIAVAPADTTVDDAVLSFEDLEIAVEIPTDRITIAAIGSVEAGTLTAQVLVENYAPVEQGQARVEVFHAIEGAPAVDVLANGNRIVELLGYPGTFGNNDGKFIVDVPAGTYDISVVPNAGGDALLELPGAELEAGTNYFIAAVGTLETADLFIATTPLEIELMTIAEIVTESEDFSTLLTAVQTADPAILEALSGEGNFTVFAPNNDAFAALPEETLNAALGDQALLTSILQYHVVGEAYTSEDVLMALEGSDSLAVETLLEGESLTITTNEAGDVFVNDIQVITFDVQASNGVIHVINGVLLPPSASE